MIYDKYFHTKEMTAQFLLVINLGNIFPRKINGRKAWYK